MLPVSVTPSKAGSDPPPTTEPTVMESPLRVILNVTTVLLLCYQLTCSATEHEVIELLNYGTTHNTAQQSSDKLPAALATMTHLLTAAPHLLSISTIMTTAVNHGLDPTGGTLYSLIVSTAVLISVGVTARQDYASNFEDFQEIDRYRLSQLIALGSINLLACLQESWGLAQSAKGYFYDNNYQVNGAVKTAFSGDWKDYTHAVVGAVSGVFSALGMDYVARGSTYFLQKLSACLPATLQKSQEFKLLVTTVLANASTLLYPLYDMKHGTQLSSYANNGKEFFPAMSLTSSALEAVSRTRRSPTEDRSDTSGLSTRIKI